MLPQTTDIVKSAAQAETAVCFGTKALYACGLHAYPLFVSKWRLAAAAAIAQIGSYSVTTLAHTRLAFASLLGVTDT